MNDNEFKELAKDFEKTLQSPTGKKRLQQELQEDILKDTQRIRAQKQLSARRFCCKQTDIIYNI